MEQPAPQQTTRKLLVVQAAAEATELQLPDLSLTKPLLGEKCWLDPLSHELVGELFYPGCGG